jgi:hypothetical protein
MEVTIFFQPLSGKAEGLFFLCSPSGRVGPGPGFFYCPSSSPRLGGLSSLFLREGANG